MASANPQNSNVWFAVALGLMGVIVGYGLATVSGSPSTADRVPQVADNPNVPDVPEPAAPSADIPEVDEESDHVRGRADARVTLVEYSDFECPFCKRHHPTVQKILQEYPNDVNVVFRHFPLSFHPNAKPAAIASECIAELKGEEAFWEFHDKVFESESFDFATMAKDLGVDAAQFDTCVKSGKYDTKISDQMNGGSSGGVNGTPGNVLIDNETGDTQLISGAVPFESFKSAIDGILGS